MIMIGTMMYAALMAAAQGAVETCTGDSLSARQLLEEDIHCSVTGEYIGAYYRNYSLTIDGPKEKKWQYRFAVTPPFVAQPPTQMKGTYEFIDDLVVFTGHWDKDGEDGP